MSRFFSKKYDAMFMELYNAGFHATMEGPYNRSLVPEELSIRKKWEVWGDTITEEDKAVIGDIVSRYYGEEWLMGTQPYEDTLIVYFIGDER